MTRFLPGIVGVAFAAVASAAVAHPLPRAMSPPANAVLTTTPAEIRITFSERLAPAFSGLELKDARGAAVLIGPSLASADNTQLAAAVKTRLAPGTYTVAWHALGDDTHHVAGRYAFRVK